MGANTNIKREACFIWTRWPRQTEVLTKPQTKAGEEANLLSVFCQSVIEWGQVDNYTQSSSDNTETNCDKLLKISIAAKKEIHI